MTFNTYSLNEKIEEYVGFYTVMTVHVKPKMEDLACM